MDYGEKTAAYHRANPGCDQARTDECRQTGSEEQLLKVVRQAYKGKSGRRSQSRNLLMRSDGMSF
jgi:hypothetical protein